MSNSISRRDFTKMTISLAGLGFSGSIFSSLNAFAQNQDDHFYLQIFLPLGVDVSYLFDARPLEMKASGKMQNYLNKEPSIYTGVNGVTCLYTECAESIKPHLDRFSIINGVLMSPSFDGHDQNTNMWFTGNPFGGDSFIPQLNHFASGLARRPIDAFMSGSILANISNSGETVPASIDDVSQLIQKLKVKPPLESQSSLSQFIASRYSQFTGNGQFSQASKAYLKAYNQVPALGDLLKTVDLSGTFDHPQKKYVAFLNQIFKSKISRSAIASLSPSNGGAVDAHDAVSAKAHPSLVKDMAEQVAVIIKAMKETAFDSSRSLLDVTTVTIASEFGRTMRQNGLSLDETGTDHNALNNSVLIGGKGIKGGMVVGSSDYQTSTEEISEAHKTLDKSLVKIMARPFDFDKLASRTDLPANFNIEDYLNVGSVTNTLYSLFGLPESFYKKTSNSGSAAPVLKKILA